jgi:hypothetical protein
MVAAYYGYTFHMASKWGPPGQPVTRNQQMTGGSYRNEPN